MSQATIDQKGLFESRHVSFRTAHLRKPLIRDKDLIAFFPDTRVKKPGIPMHLKGCASIVYHKALCLIDCQPQ